MYGDFGGAFKALFYFMATMLAIFVPLGAWKLVEIGIWFFSHLHWGGKP